MQTVQSVKRPAFAEGSTEGALRTRTFSWLLETIVPRGLTMLDLGAGPCVFARRAAEAGYYVTAVDGRTDRVPDDLPERVRFVQADVRGYPVDGYDVTTILGLLYHLTLNEQIELLQSCGEGTVIVDTQIHDQTLMTSEAGEWARTLMTTEAGYQGVVFPEGNNVMAAIGNPWSFWHTEPSLLRLFEHCAFQDVTIIDPAYVSKYGARKFYVLR